MLQGRVGIAKGNNGDIDVAALAYRLGIRPGIGDNKKPRLAELLRDLVRKGPRGESARDTLGASVVGELEHGAHAPRTSGNGYDVLRVLDGDDDARGEHY